MLESPFSTPITKRPDISQKFLDGQVSGIEMKIGEAIVDLLGLPIIRQLMIYNPVYPIHPFEIDIYVPEKDLALDVNGKSHKTDKLIQRQERKDKAVLGLTGISEYISVDVSTPPSLLYWHKTGQDREETKRINDIYYDGLIYETVQKVKQAKFRPTLATPRVIKSAEMYQRGLDRLKELKK